MLLSAVMCTKPLRHRNVNIKLYINQIYVNTIIHSHMVLSIIFLEEKHKIVLHLSIFYEYQQFF
jgi:hypothetical protein